MQKKLLAILLCSILAVIGLIAVTHFRSTYSFSCDYTVSFWYGGQKNASLYDVRLMVPCPPVIAKLHPARCCRYRTVSTPYGKYIQITAAKIDIVPPSSPGNSSHSALYGPVEKFLLDTGVKRVSSRPLNELCTKCSLPVIKNGAQNRTLNRTLNRTSQVYSIVPVGRIYRVGRIPVFVSYRTDPDTVIHLDISLTRTSGPSSGAKWGDDYSASLTLKGSQNGWFNATVYRIEIHYPMKRD